MAKKLISVICCFCFFGYALGVPVAGFLRAINDKPLLSGPNCGTSILPPSSPDRIVGGEDAEHGQYPFMVSLEERSRYSGFDHVCGAAVLNENWIITAAHCIDYVTEPSFYKIRVGMHKLSERYAGTVQTIKISKVILHEKYVNYDEGYDIALLKTATPIDIEGSGGYANSICLPRSNRDPAGFARITGWGDTQHGGEGSDTLKAVVVPMVSRKTCERQNDWTPITDSMICAGIGGRDSCQNDSGGPLFQTDSDGVSTLIGIVSFGKGCGIPGYPGVYTKVSSHLNWIERTVSRN